MNTASVKIMRRTDIVYIFFLEIGVKLKLLEKIAFLSVKKKLLLTGAGTILAFFLLIGFALFGLSSYAESNTELLSAVQENDRISVVKSELSQINSAISLELIDGEKRKVNLDYSKTKLKEWLDSSNSCQNASGKKCDYYQKLGKEYYHKAGNVYRNFSYFDPTLPEYLTLSYNDIFKLRSGYSLRKVSSLSFYKWLEKESSKNGKTPFFINNFLPILAKLRKSIQVEKTDDRERLTNSLQKVLNEIENTSDNLQDIFDSNEKHTLIFKNRLGTIHAELFSMFNTLSQKKLNTLKENRESQKKKGTALTFALVIIATLSGAAIFIVFFLLIGAIIQPITVTGEKLEELSQHGGDLSHLLPVISHDEVGEMTKSFNSFLTNLRHIVGTVQDSTEELSSISHSISSGTTEASSKISETSAFADDISARLSEATNHIVATVESMEKVTKIISSVSIKSDDSSKSLNNALESMIDIQGASKEITEINEVVNEIAFQINILSLNAAIEAARAGEYGKGFAVVAEEVRELSIKTTESAAKIKQLIHTTNNKIESGSKLVKQTSSMLLEILREFRSIFTEIDRRTGELKSNTERIEQIDKAVENVRNIINENAAYIEEMAAASEDMANHVKSLHGEVKRFKV